MGTNITLHLQKELMKKFDFSSKNNLTKNFFNDEITRILNMADIDNSKVEILFDYFKDRISELKGNYDIDIEEKRKVLLEYIDPSKFQTWEKYARYVTTKVNNKTVEIMTTVLDIKIKTNTSQPEESNFSNTNDNINVLGERIEVYNAGKYHELLSKAEKRIDIIAITGEKIFLDLIDIIKEKLLTKNISIKFLTIDPNSEFMELRLKKLHGNSQTDFLKFSNLLKFQFPNILYKLKEDNIDIFRKNDANIEHRYYDNIPYFGFIRVDDQIIYEIYTSHQKSKKSLVLTFNRKNQLFEYFTDHFNSLWYSSKEKFRIDSGTEAKNIYEEITGKNSKFAPYTIASRFPKLVSNLLEQQENQKYKQSLELLKEINKIEFIIGKHSEYKIWNKYIAKFNDKNIHNVPFLFAEFYFYWKILDATNYFETKIDPFRNQKQASALKATNSIQDLVKFVFDKNITINDKWENIFTNLLWSNREGDLSQISMLSSKSNSEKEQILINDTLKSHDFIKNNCYQVDFILDNSGYELATTLVLVFFLFENKLVKDINLHAKKYPFFVSDTTIEDINFMLKIFAEHSDENINYMAETLTSYLNKNLKVYDDEFWTEPINFDNDKIKNKLYRSHLVIIQGDLNYRRLIGDNLWAYDMDINLLTKYFPTNFLIIRTLKSEVLVNVPYEKVQEISENNPQWLTDGSYGIIQLVKR